MITCAQLGDEPERFRLMDGIGDHHHPIQTDSKTAQRYFDQGLTLSLGFNHDAAIASYQEALKDDPECTMCYWGIAHAAGPNINLLAMGPEAGELALSSIARARELAPKAMEKERAYVEAIAARYSRNRQGQPIWNDEAYARAAKKLHEAYPQDLDAATLYAESLMMLSPWDYWTKADELRPELAELVPTLESVLKQNPHHPGANHLYIHAVEASYPEKAVPAADRLRSFAPAVGHLVHMPSHIYWRVGRYQDAGELNVKAAAADEAFIAWCKSQANGLYAAQYYPHNLHFLWAVATVEGNEALARISGNKLKSKIPKPMIEQFPLVEAFVPTPLFTLARFGRWDEILGTPKPDAELRFTIGIWHYARGLAYLRTDRRAQAEAELAALRELASDPDLVETKFVVSTAAGYLALGRQHLAGELAAAGGDLATAVAELELGIELEEGMLYTEPPPWYYPIRQALGAVLLEAGEAKRAEQVFRTDLEKNPGQGWALYGLAQSLRAQGKDDDAAVVDRGFENAWARADTKLSAPRF